MSSNIEDKANDIVLEVRNLNKIFGKEKQKARRLKKEGKSKSEIAKLTNGSTVALWNINLDVKKGETFVIIGMSGSGKSTLVRCLNLLNKPTSGEILYKGKDISKLSEKDLIKYRRENISMVFQNFGLFSHKNVLENVEFGLEVKGVDKEERHKKSMEMIKMVGLEGYENESINSLSGGMKQRVGLARALTSDPEILLMDEPFSALDPLVKKNMQFELLSIQRKLGKTIVFITHDIDEAFKLGDRVAIMKDGEIIQIDSPEDMTTHPKNDYVVNFIDNADKTKIITVQNIMNTPDTIIRDTDSSLIAIKTMRNSKLSSAYVVDDKLRFKGIVTITDVLDAEKNNKTIKDILIKDVEKVNPDALVTDIIDIAANTKFPIAVVDEKEEFLMGIVTKTDVLSSIN